MWFWIELSLLAMSHFMGQLGLLHSGRCLSIKLNILWKDRLCVGTHCAGLFMIGELSLKPSAHHEAQRRWFLAGEWGRGRKLRNSMIDDLCRILDASSPFYLGTDGSDVGLRSSLTWGESHKQVLGASKKLLSFSAIMSSNHWGNGTSDHECLPEAEVFQKLQWHVVYISTQIKCIWIQWSREPGVQNGDADSESILQIVPTSQVQSFIHTAQTPPDTSKIQNNKLDKQAKNYRVAQTL